MVTRITVLFTIATVKQMSPSLQCHNDPFSPPRSPPHEARSSLADFRTVGTRPPDRATQGAPERPLRQACAAGTVQHGVEEKVVPPVKAPLEDAARALQFVRSKAGEWNIDKKRSGATGGSAGGCSSLWLAFHDDMADPTSKDPIARESTRLHCAAVNGAQTSLDPRELREWMPNYSYGAHAFGLPNFQSLIDNRDKVLEWIKEYSPIDHVSKDDPPIALFYDGDKDVKVGDSPKDPTHSPILGIKLEEKLKAIGVDVVLVYPGHPHEKYKNSADYLIDRLMK